MGSTTLGGYSQYNLPSKNQQTENLQPQESQRTVRHRENKQESFKKMNESYANLGRGITTHQRMK